MKDRNTKMNELTLRDWFAGRAMQGMLAHPEVEEDYVPNQKIIYTWERAYRFADKMMAQRDK